MRYAHWTLSSLAALALVAGGCAESPAPEQAVYTPPVTEDWVLIAPPDDEAVVAMLESTRALPRPGDRLPSAPPPGVSQEAWEDAGALFAEVMAEATTEDRASLVIERAAKRFAPADDWRRVRQFDSAEKCRTTRDELIKVTRQYSDELGITAGMHKDDLVWPMMNWSYRWSQCVPVA